METYVWLAIAVAASLTIFLIWVWSDGRQGASLRLGSEKSAGVLVETEADSPSISAERPPG